MINALKKFLFGNRKKGMFIIYTDEYSQDQIKGLCELLNNKSYDIVVVSLNTLVQFLPY
jgi:hypothetical protein